MTVMQKKFQPKVSGVNLIGLMISASLGAFILGVIVRVSFTVGDNFQIIKAITELEASSRILTDFFYRVLPNVGFNNNNDIIVKINSVSVGKPIYSLSFATNPSIDGILKCSRRAWSSSKATQRNQTIYFREPGNDFWNNINDLDKSGFITCADAVTLSASDIANAKDAMPVVSRSNIADLKLNLIVAEEDPATNAVAKIADVQVNSTAAGSNTDKPLAYGMKISILLKSTDMIFNQSRLSKFENIFGSGTGYTFENNDQHLYKLVTIAAPFTSAISVVNPDDNNNRVTMVSS